MNGRYSRPQPGPLLVIILVASLISVRGTSAHIDVLPSTAPASTLQTFNLRVPNEKDEPTVNVRVEFPAGLIVSRFQPKPGWQRQVEKDTAGRITAAIWSGGQIGAGEYEDFTFLARTPRQPGKLVWKAYQTYQGGETVAWAGSEDDELPAPVVQVVESTAEPDATSATIEETRTAEATVQSSVAAPPVTSELPAVASQPPAVPVPTDETLVTAVPGLEAGAGTVTPESTDVGSDLPLFTALAALITALVSLAMAGVALARRRTTS